MDEKKYPIYQFGFKWDQDGYESNGTGFSRMYKKDPGIDCKD